MQLDEGLKLFLRQPLMVILGTADSSNRPSIARAMGVFDAVEEGHLDMVFSSWQWPDTVANIRDSGRLAMTVVSPSNYTSYQMKGKAWLGSPKPEVLERSDAYIRVIEAELHGLGVPPHLTEPWLCNRERVLATLKVAEIYVQTPGPNAGMAAGRAR